MDGLAVVPIWSETSSEPLLSGGVFVNSQRLGGFLRYVVEESLEGRAGNLKEYQIGLVVFGRPESFDPKAGTLWNAELTLLPPSSIVKARRSSALLSESRSNRAREF